ncbi:MAG: hypothetical protein A3C47_00590 [Omnitrophica bacterium RIFCSPHIGHO2_02_FULL_51_18]|nr:MAG: hypothetical protein A3C47_00590 [Omnitrophica bacterium RIFCSPHIGHO2_02_FULL_51_18]
MPTQAFSVLWNYRRALIAIVKNEVRQRYAGSILGIAWLLIYPLLFLSIYAGIYIFIFKIKVPELSNWGYVLTVFCGLVPYIGFSDSLQQGSRALIGNSNLLKNTVFPAELIPVKVVLASQVLHAASLGVLTLFVLASGYSFQRFWIVPCVFILQFLLTQGLVWMLSAATVAIKDIPHVLNLLLLFLLFVSPVAFLPVMAPEKFQPFLWLNPLYYVISLYRTGFSISSHLNFYELLILAAVSLLFFGAGYAFFNKLKTIFLEYV